MLYISKTFFVYRFYKILVIEPTTEVKAESIGAPSVKEIGLAAGLFSNFKRLFEEFVPMVKSLQKSHHPITRYDICLLYIKCLSRLDVHINFLYKSNVKDIIISFIMSSKSNLASSISMDHITVHIK
jgi:hypothetical protein